MGPLKDSFRYLPARTGTRSCRTTDLVGKPRWLAPAPKQQCQDPDPESLHSALTLMRPASTKGFRSGRLPPARSRQKDYPSPVAVAVALQSRSCQPATGFGQGLVRVGAAVQRCLVSLSGTRQLSAHKITTHLLFPLPTYSFAQLHLPHTISLSHHCLSLFITLPSTT